MCRSGIRRKRLPRVDWLVEVEWLAWLLRRLESIKVVWSGGGLVEGGVAAVCAGVYGEDKRWRGRCGCTAGKAFIFRLILNSAVSVVAIVDLQIVERLDAAGARAVAVVLASELVIDVIDVRDSEKAAGAEAGGCAAGGIGSGAVALPYPGVYLAEEAMAAVLFQFNVDRFCFAQFLDAGEFCAVGLAIEGFDLVDDIRRQVLGSRAGIVQKELLAIEVDLIDLLALHSHVAVLVDLEAGQLT